MNNRIWVLISFLVGLVLFSWNCFATTCNEENWVIYCNDVTSYTDTNWKVFSWIGTITISSGDKSITMLDRNLGATTNDISKTGSYWYYFQWGTWSSINTWYKGDWDNLCPEWYKIPTSWDLSKLNSIILGSSNCKNGSNTWKCVSNLLHIPFASSYTDMWKFLNDMAWRYRTSTFNSKKDSFYWSIITSEIRLNNKIASNNLWFSIRCFANEPHQFVTLSFSWTNSEIQNQLLISWTKAQSPDEPEMSWSQFSGWYLTWMKTKWNFETDVVTWNITLYAKWIDENEEENESEDINIETEQSWNCVRLPEWYKEVEYIESHGQEYIDTNLLFNKDKDSRLSIVISNIQSLEKTAIFWAQSGNSRSFIYFNKQLYLWNGESRNDIILNNDKHILSAKWLSNSWILQWFLDDELNFSKPQYGEFASDISLYLLYVHNGNGAIPIGLRLYWFKAYISDDLVFDWVPCITSGRKYGLYDLVSNKFFWNSGEWDFSGGSIVEYDSCQLKDPIEDESNETYTVNFIYENKNPIQSIISWDNIWSKTFKKWESIEFPDINYIIPFPTTWYIFSWWIRQSEQSERTKEPKDGSIALLKAVKFVKSSNEWNKWENELENTVVSSDMTFIAQFKEAESTIGSWENENVNSWENQIINTWSRRKKKSNKTTENNETEQKNSNIVYNESFSEELNDAYKFAYENNITTMDSIEKADMYWKMDRISMAKMLSQFAINVLWKTPADIEVPNFTDISEELDEQYLSWVSLAYQLWIMWINMPNNEFRPFDLVPRAEFWTALSRMLYKLADWNDIYYSTHLNKLKSEWILKDINPSLLELRWWWMLMLMRSSSK